MAYRDDLQALEQRHADLDRDVVERTQQRDQLRAMIDELRRADEARRIDEARRAGAALLAEEEARRLEAERAARPSPLAKLRIASPCKADWNAMVGDDRVRHCETCQKNVYNLSGMTYAEAEALVIEREGELCARFYRRADGTILLKDCTVGAWRRRHVKIAAAGIAAGLAAAAYGRFHEAPPAPRHIEASYSIELGGSIGSPQPEEPQEVHSMMGRVGSVTEGER